MKQFQLIHVDTNDAKRKDQLTDELIANNVTAFGIGQHIIAIDDKPAGVNIDQHYHPYSVKKVLKTHKARELAKSCHAQLLSFDDSAFKAFKKYFSKLYQFKKESANQLIFKSKTQKAHFTLNRNGKVSTSKDLLDVDLLVNIVRIEYGEKPINPMNAVG